jgi:hypothetical protein
VFNGLRYIVKTGNQWWMMPHDLPRGQWFINKCDSGWMPGVSRSWLKICAFCCVNLQAARASQRR